MWLRPRDHCFFEIMLHKILHEFNLFFVPIALDPLFTQELKADVVRFVESRVILPNSHFSLNVELVHQVLCEVLLYNYGVGTCEFTSNFPSSFTLMSLSFRWRDGFCAIL